MLDQQRTERSAEGHLRSRCPSSADGRCRFDHAAADWQVCIYVTSLVFIPHAEDFQPLATAAWKLYVSYNNKAAFKAGKIHN